jgi:hypothetical protein
MNPKFQPVAICEEGFLKIFHLNKYHVCCIFKNQAINEILGENRGFDSQPEKKCFPAAASFRLRA